MKWNKQIKARMWADMITDNIKRKEDIAFTKAITKYFVAISATFLVTLWSVYFIYGI